MFYLQLPIIQKNASFGQNTETRNHCLFRIVQKAKTIGSVYTLYVNTHFTRVMPLCCNPTIEAGLSTGLVGRGYGKSDVQTGALYTIVLSDSGLNSAQLSNSDGTTKQPQGKGTNVCLP